MSAFRTDLATVGMVAWKTDVFVLGGLILNNPSYHLLVYDSSANQYVMLEGGIGSFLSSNGQLPSPYVLHYFTATQGRIVTYPQSMFHMILTPFLDAGGTVPAAANGTVFPLVDKNNNCILQLGTLTSTFPGIMFDSTDPIEFPSTGNPLCGYKYNLYASPIQTGQASPILASIPIYQRSGVLPTGTDPTTTPYGGLPFGVLSPPQLEVGSYTMAFLPLNWWLSSDSENKVCQTQISSSFDFSNVVYNICPRFTTLTPGSSTTGFNLSTCQNIGSFVGNTRQSDCQASSGKLYYVPDGYSGVSPTQVATTTPLECGKAWGPNTTFINLVGATITNINNPYGNCNIRGVTQAAPSYCSYGANNVATCIAIPQSSSSSAEETLYNLTLVEDTPPCTDDNNCANCSFDCSTDCSTANCPNACSNCPPVCDNLPAIKSVPGWMWILIAILAIIMVALFFLVMHEGSAKPKEPKHKAYDKPTSDNSSKTKIEQT